MSKEAWNLNKEQREKFKPIINNYIEKINNTDECESLEDLNLTNQGINPYQLGKLLEELGYEEGDMDSNGWQFDFWLYFTKKGDTTRANRLCVSGCGITFELKLGAVEDY